MATVTPAADEELQKANEKLNLAESELTDAKAELKAAKGETPPSPERIAEAKMGVAEAKMGVAEAKMGVAEAKWESAGKPSSGVYFNLVDVARKAYENLLDAAQGEKFLRIMCLSVLCDCCAFFRCTLLLFSVSALLV
jgi:chromosome segregation ATPase